MAKGRKSEEIEAKGKARIFPEDVEGIRTTDPMVILREKGGNGTPHNPILRDAVCDTVRTLTVLTLQKTKTVEREMKIQRMVCTPKIPGDNDTCRLNTDSSSGIYLPSVMEDECRVVTTNRRKQEEAKKST